MNHLRLPLYIMGVRSRPEEETLMQLDVGVGLSNGCYVYYIPEEQSLLILNVDMATKWSMHLAVPTR